MYYDALIYPCTQDVNLKLTTLGPESVSCVGDDSTKTVRGYNGTSLEAN